jgi:hypothetical protein
VRSDDKRLDISNIDIATGNGERCESNVSRDIGLFGPGAMCWDLQRSEFFWSSLNSCDRDGIAIMVSFTTPRQQRDSDPPS